MKALKKKQARCINILPCTAARPRSCAATSAGLDLLVLDAPHLFDRPGGPYGDPTGADWPDNWRRFAALSQAGADIAAGAIAGYRPDVVHAHDWQAALTLAYMRYGRGRRHAVGDDRPQSRLPGPVSAPAIFGELGLPAAAMALDGVEYYGGVGYLKAGLQAAWAITTVSPTYAQEIRTPRFGMGLDGLVIAARGRPPRHRQRHRHRCLGPADGPASDGANIRRRR